MPRLALTAASVAVGASVAVSIGTLAAAAAADVQPRASGRVSTPPLTPSSGAAQPPSGAFLVNPLLQVAADPPVGGPGCQPALIQLVVQCHQVSRAVIAAPAEIQEPQTESCPATAIQVLLQCETTPASGPAPSHPVPASQPIAQVATQQRARDGMRCQQALVQVLTQCQLDLEAARRQDLTTGGGLLQLLTQTQVNSASAPSALAPPAAAVPPIAGVVPVVSVPGVLEAGPGVLEAGPGALEAGPAPFEAALPPTSVFVRELPSKPAGGGLAPPAGVAESAPGAGEAQPAPQPRAVPELPVTGADLKAIAAVGTLLLLLGSAAIGVRRRVLN